MDVPVPYVLRVLFKHEQKSFLTVRDEAQKDIGTFSLHPSITGTNERSLDCSGTFWIQSPMAQQRQRFNFSAALAMDAALRVRTFHLDVNLPEQHVHITVDGDVARNLLSYQMHQGSQLTSAQTLPMDPAALGPALAQDLGVETNAMSFANIGNIERPSVTARETQITLHGEQLDVYQISVLEGTMRFADIYVTQLGQIVLAKTGFGYSLSAEDYQ
jgi:hypothetical protein